MPTEGAHMGKKQKNAFLDEGLLKVLDHIEKLSGASFSRTVTASLLEYVFGSLIPGDPDPHPDSMHMWMRLAVEVEKGEISIEDIPLTILDAGIVDAEQAIRLFNREDAKRGLEWLKEHRQSWKNNIEDMGKMGAIEYMLKGGFPPQK